MPWACAAERHVHARRLLQWKGRFLQCRDADLGDRDRSRTRQLQQRRGMGLLPDGTILMLELWASDLRLTSRYNWTTGVWTSAGDTVAFADNALHVNGTIPSHEIGAGLLRPNGTVFWLVWPGADGDRPHWHFQHGLEHLVCADRTFQITTANDAPGAPCCPTATCCSRQLQPIPTTFTARRVGSTNSTERTSPSRRATVCGAFNLDWNFQSYSSGCWCCRPGQVLLTEQSSHVELYTSSGSPTLRSPRRSAACRSG